MISVGVLGLLLYSQTSALQEERRRVRELTVQLESTRKAASLDLQEKCAHQAQQEFKMEGLDLSGKNGMSDYSSHYNEKLNKCFV